MATLGNQKEMGSTNPIVEGGKVKFPAHSIVIGNKIVHIPTMVMGATTKDQCFGAMISDIVFKYPYQPLNRKIA